MTRTVHILAVSLLLSTACSGNDLVPSERLGTVSETLTVIPAGTFLPLPVLVDGNQLPAADPSGKHVAGWDGSTAELLAADALGQCMLSSAFFTTDLSTQARGLDEFLYSLRARMAETTCHINNESLYPISGAAGGDIIERWFIGRMTPGCNINPVTGDDAVVPLPERDISAYLSFTSDFKNTWTTVLSHTGAIDTGDDFGRVARAVSNAELNLCMAQRMQEQLNSATMLFASDSDQLELLGYVRERAQLATLQYSLLAKVLTAPGPTPTGVTNRHQLLTLFRAWAEQSASGSKLAVMGADFATAIRLDLQATNDFAQLLRRQASARSQVAQLGSIAEADWGDFSPRVRLLNLLYGGDPLTTSETPKPGRGFGGVALKDLPFVHADMSSPELGTLLGLARSADALDFKFDHALTSPDVATGIDAAATASRLYVTIERRLQQQRCDARGEDPCPLAATPPSELDEYLLWTEHRIRLTHATKLVEAFSQALGPSATGSISDPASSAEYGFGTAMFHLLGKHRTTQIEGEPWLHLDSQFDIRSLSPQELAIRFDPGRFLPAEIDLSTNAYQQGFVTNRDTLFSSPENDGPGGSWAELRALGTVQVLAFAREAILQGRGAISAVSPFFIGDSTSPGANPVLPLIEKSIGISTVAIRPDQQPTNKTGSACETPGLVEYLGPPPCRVLEQKRSGNNAYFNVDFWTTTSSSFTKLAAGNYRRDLESAALAPEFESFRGVARADVDALQRLSTTSSTTYGSGDSARVRHRFAVTKSLEPGSPGTSCNSYIERLTNGNLRFSVTFPAPQFYVEVFSRKNGIQNVAQNIVASQVQNGDGTFTYSLTRNASLYQNGNQVTVRFYSYRSGQPGVFTPGPAETVWSDTFTYGSTNCTPQAPVEVTGDNSITLLVAEDAGARTYLPLNQLPRREFGGYFLGLGSSLNALARDAWRVQPANWSTPVLDAFNLPMDWVPPADASLVGGLPGQESYQYFLSSAKDAAQQATLAVQTAIQSVSEETSDVAALANADGRAKEIGNIEKRGLCGDAEDCDLTTTLWTPTINNECIGLVDGTPKNFCDTLYDQLVRLVGSVALPQLVIDQLTSAAPDFSRFAGGELERILTGQWNGAKGLQLAVDNQTSAALAYGRELTAGYSALTAAKADRDAKVATAEAQIATAGGQAGALRVTVRGLLADVETAQIRADRQCCSGDTPAPPCRVDGLSLICSWCYAPPDTNLCGLASAICQGATWSGPDLKVYYRAADGTASYTVGDEDSKSFSPGPLFAAEQQCAELRLQLTQLLKTTGPTIVALNRQIAALDTATLEAALADEKAARAAYDAAYMASLSSVANATAQFSAQLSSVQQAQSSLLSSVTELGGAIGRKEAALARADLDADLANRDIETRFGLRRKFQSYDLWRARALLESARRMSVAARRAIEARFVVDLSKLDASQVFVEAPSLWADEIYDSDLNAPAAVGLSQTPTIEGAAFPNKLVDYVGNLERFVQGYTVSSPTSVASPDTEILTIPGPDVRIFEDTDEDQASIERVDPATRGWQFSCSPDGPWFSHPGAAEYPLVTQISSACEGRAPARARFSFGLDPWGRLNAPIASAPFSQKHNVRWRRLAVNLVGTGVRDCTLADDPSACYTNSFVRYDLEHVGPAWVTNHSQQWRSYAIPTGRIEAAKALATEEWLDPIANSWTVPIVSNVARAELAGRPIGGAYELILQLTPDIRLERIERIQILTETEYWVRQD